MTAVYDDGKFRFPVEILKGSLNWPRVIRVNGLNAVLHGAKPTKSGGYLFEFWLDVGIGFLVSSDDLYAVHGAESDFTVLGLSNDN